MKIKKAAITNKELNNKTNKIMQGKYELAVIVLKPGKKSSFDLYSIEKNMEKAIEIRKKLQLKGYLVRIVKKSKGGNKHNSAYLSEFSSKKIAITIGINRTLEANIIDLRNKLNPSFSSVKTNKEKSGYMAFAYHKPTTSFVSTRLYDTEKEAIEFISKRWGVDLDTIETIDTSRLINGSFRFSKKEYEKYNRVKGVKQHKLIDKFGKQEALAMIDLLEQKRQELYESKQKALDLIEEVVGKDTDREIIEDPIIQKNYDYLNRLIEKVRNIQANINKSNNEILEYESSAKGINNKLVNAKDFSNRANNNALEAQKLLEKILNDNSDDNKSMYN